MHRFAIALLLAALIPGSPAAGRQDPAGPGSHDTVVRVQDGDRILFLGDSFFEREYRFGLIETALTVAHPDKRLTFRNIGWSGDTVWGEARAYFGGRAEGYAELLKFVTLIDPSVILVAYGANESFSGEEGLQEFIEQYRRLLGDLEAQARRIVLLTPLPADAATSPLPRLAVDGRNQVLSRYGEAIGSIAQARGLPVIDLFGAMLGATAGGQPHALFENGIHLTEAGYVVAADAIARRTTGAAMLNGFSSAWRRVDAAPPDPGGEPLRAIRRLVVEKNDLFFHRWRPANVTYLFLFRQREQGSNAVEIPRFDPLVEQKEREIDSLRRPRP